MSKRTTPARRPMFTLTEACAYIGVSDRTLRRYIADGKLKVSRINARVIRIDPAELDRFLGLESA